MWSSFRQNLDLHPGGSAFKKDAITNLDKEAYGETKQKSSDITIYGSIEVTSAGSGIDESNLSSCLFCCIHFHTNTVG